MKIPKWICIKCEHTFTRRWNASRHCKNKHGTILDSIIKFREYLMNRPNYQLALTKDKVSGFNQLPYQQNWNIQDKRLNPYTNTISNPIDDSTSEEKLLYNTLDELAPKYEEIENLLSSIPEKLRPTILGGIVNQAIYSDNPIAFIDTRLKKLRRNKPVIKRMIKNVSVLYGCDEQFTKEYLKIGIKKGINKNR